MNIPLFYRDEPLFGFDIGYNSLKVMEIDTSAPVSRVMGYGYANFDPMAIKNGIVVNPEAVAKEAYDLIAHHLVGSLDTRRIGVAIPVSRTYVRVLTVPHMAKEDLDEAVRVETEQYLPVAIDGLYLDYEIGSSLPDDQIEVLVVASPKAIVDSYVTLFDLLGLEVAVLETTISSSTRLVKHAERTDLPTLMIDFGTNSTDLSIFDRTLRVTGTITDGGDAITKIIGTKLGITPKQAQIVKTRHGLNAGKRQQQIITALEPVLDNLVEEVKRMVRFYQQRTGNKRKLEQVIIVGGGANLPGLADFLTDKIRIPTRTADPWLNLDFGKLQPPHQLEKTLYATAAGLALIQPREITQ